MIKHSWKDDVCCKCGIKRERRDRQVLDHTYTKLGRDGVWYDQPVWTLQSAYAYSFDGDKWSFNRPDCVLKTGREQQP